MQIRMKLERETKNAVRFQEVDAKSNPVDPANVKIGTLYIKKSAFEGAVPSHIKVEFGPEK